MNFTELLGMSFPTIQTEQIRLRKLKRDDAPSLYNYYSNENVYRYLDWNNPLKEVLRLFIFGMRASKKAG